MLNGRRMEINGKKFENFHLILLREQPPPHNAAIKMFGMRSQR